MYLPLRPSPDERPRILRQTHGNAKETNHHNVKTFLVIQGFFFDSITEFFQPESNGAPFARVLLAQLCNVLSYLDVSDQRLRDLG